MKVRQKTTEAISINQYIGLKLRELRSKEKMSQTELGQLLSKKIRNNKKPISYQTIKIYETGVSSFKIDHLCALAEIFNVDLFYFLDVKRKIILKDSDKEIILDIPLRNRETVLNIINNILKFKKIDSLEVLSKLSKCLLEYQK